MDIVDAAFVSNDMPEGFIKLPLHRWPEWVEYVPADSSLRLPVAIRKSAVIGVIYHAAKEEISKEVPNLFSKPLKTYKETVQCRMPEYCTIIIQGGQKFDVPCVTFWQVMEWLK